MRVPCPHAPDSPRGSGSPGAITTIPAGQDWADFDSQAQEQLQPSGGTRALQSARTTGRIRIDSSWRHREYIAWIATVTPPSSHGRCLTLRRAMGTAHRLAHGFYPSAGAGITLACVQAPVTGTGWTRNGD